MITKQLSHINRNQPVTVSITDRFNSKRSNCLDSNSPTQLCTVQLSGVARAFPGGRLAHPEGQNEDEN